MITIIENTAFQSQVGVCIKSGEKDELFDFSAREPKAGDEIPGTGGIRKLRWGGKGKGKRGGSRVIYYFITIAPHFFCSPYMVKVCKKI